MSNHDRRFCGKRNDIQHSLLLSLSLSLSFAGYKWVKWPAPYADSRMLIIIGRDLDGRNLAVGRAMHQGDILPAKVKIEQNIAYVSHGGKEHVKHNFEVNFAENREIRSTVSLVP